MKKRAQVSNTKITREHWKNNSNNQECKSGKPTGPRSSRNNLVTSDLQPRVYMQRLITMRHRCVGVQSPAAGKPRPASAKEHTQGNPTQTPQSTVTKTPGIYQTTAFATLVTCDNQVLSESLWCLDSTVKLCSHGGQTLFVAVDMLRLRNQ